jgi:hypothetical protein
LKAAELAVELAFLMKWLLAFPRRVMMKQEAVMHAQTLVVKT